MVVSLLPWQLHPSVARKCIELGKDMVTASYCTPPMQELDAAAKEAEITVMNEVGQDFDVFYVI